MKYKINICKKQWNLVHKKCVRRKLHEEVFKERKRKHTKTELGAVNQQGETQGNWQSKELGNESQQ
jgi:hypothetical protein